jgi:response regulator RpfG family c-di-GMP phosphodiesterase
MLNILIADDELELQELYEMILEVELSCTFYKAFNGEQAINILKEVNDIDLIISDYNMPIFNGAFLYKYNVENKNLPFLLLSGGELEDYVDFKNFRTQNPLNHFFNKPFDIENFIAIVKQISAAKDSNVTNTPKSTGFTRISISHFKKASGFICDLYLKINENKYTKIVKENENINSESELLDHYKQKGINEVYIRDENLKDFICLAFNNLEKKILDGQKVVQEIILGGINFNVSLEGLKCIGLNDFTISKANDAIENAVIDQLKNRKAKNNFEEICKSQGKLIGHSLLTAYIACKLLKESKLEFNSNLKKIVISSFYHDCSLLGVPDELHEMNFNDIDDSLILKKIQHHPVESSEMMPEGNDPIDESRKIILEHHEKPDGDGYPRGLDAFQISPLGCLFILSQEITFCIMRNDFDSDRLREFLVNKKESFNKGNFAQFYEVAYQIFVNKGS